MVWAYAKQYGIDKLKWVVSGGETGQESIRNGVYNLMDKCDDDDNVIIHDGIRPFSGAGSYYRCVAKCNEYGQWSIINALQRTDFCD